MQQGSAAVLAHEALEQVVREDWGRLLGTLIRRHGRPDLAEDRLAEAVASAVDQWVEDGGAEQSGRVARLRRASASAGFAPSGSDCRRQGASGGITRGASAGTRPPR